MSQVTQILKILAAAHTGLTVQHVCDALEYDDLNMLRVRICQMITKNFIMKDDKMLCPTCGHPSQYYRITNEGRVHLNSKIAI